MLRVIKPQKPGRAAMNTITHGSGIWNLFCGSLINIAALSNPPVRTVLYRQIYFTGIEPLGAIAIIGIVIAIVIITQTANIVGINAPLVGKVLVWSVVKEIGPLFIAKIVITRSCSAIASELGAMKVNRELDFLKAMGIDPLEYLVVPRIAGIAITTTILTFYFQISAILGGLLMCSILTDIHLIHQTKEIFSALSVSDIGLSLFKSAFFGLMISTISCYHGIRIQSTIREIPMATSLAVTQSQMMVLLFDGIIAVLVLVC